MGENQLRALPELLITSPMPRTSAATAPRHGLRTGRRGQGLRHRVLAPQRGGQDPGEFGTGVGVSGEPFLDAERPGDVFKLSTHTHTEWEFLSDTVDSEYFDPFSVMKLDYDLAIDAGQTMPFSSCDCSTAAAIMRAGPTP